METAITELSPITIIGWKWQWWGTIAKTLREWNSPFTNIRISEKDDFLWNKNAAIATADIIIHTAGEEAMEELKKIYEQRWFAEMVFPGKVFLEICSTKRSIQTVLELMHNWWVDICSLHPLCKPDKTSRIVSDMLIMPWRKESPGHMFARKLTSMLDMNQNEHLTFGQHDTIMETSQVKRHIAAWKWLEDIAEETKKLWLSIHEFPFPISERIMIAGLARVWSGKTQLSAKIIGNSFWWDKGKIIQEAERFTRLLTDIDPDGSFVKTMNKVAESCIHWIFQTQLCWDIATR